MHLRSKNIVGEQDAGYRRYLLSLNVFYPIKDESHSLSHEKFFICGCFTLYKKWNLSSGQKLKTEYG